MDELIFFSTDPNSNKGGISSSVQSFLKCLENKNLKTKIYVTHHPNSNIITNALRFLLVTTSFLWAISFRDRRKKSVYLHVGPKGSLIRKLFIAELCSLFNIKIFTHHHSALFDLYLEQGGVFSKALKRLSKISYKNFVLSEWWQSRYKNFGILNTSVIPNGVSATYSDGDTPKKQHRPPRILAIGRLVNGKNFDLVIRAVGAIKDPIELIIAGGGPELKRLQALAKNTPNPDLINFVGWVEGSKKTRLYAESDIFVLPSNYDSFGIVYIESLAHGCPVVIGPNPAVISALNGLGGVYIAEDFSIGAISRTISLALSQSTDRAALSKLCLDKYGTATIANSLLSELEIVNAPN